MTIYAFTELYSEYPAFINLSHQTDGTTKVTVRSRGDGGRNIGTITLTADQMNGMQSAINDHCGDEVKARWISRALLAEHALYKAGLRTHTPADVWSDDAWLCATLTHKDGSPVHITHLQEARERLAAVKGHQG